MYSKEEALAIKKEFWTAFATAYPRKWLLYDTKIKDVTFKFYIDNKKAQVLLDIEPKDEEKRKQPRNLSQNARPRHNRSG